MFSSVATVFSDMVDGTSVAAKLEDGMLQREGARGVSMFSTVATVFSDMEDGTKSVADKLEEGVLQRYGGWYNESVATKLEDGMLQREGARGVSMFSTVATVFSDMVDGTTSVAAKLEEGVLQREGAREKGISNVFECCNSVLRYGRWNECCS
jgi:hypothetical protein